MLIGLAMASSLSAVPARRGTWKWITTADGQRIRVEQAGDEYLHYWRTADGKAYVFDSAKAAYHSGDMPALERRAKVRKAKRDAQRKQQSQVMRAKRRTSGSNEMKCLVLMVDFADLAFQEADSAGFYRKMLNDPGFSERQFRGSVRDYFMAQSNGTFAPSFQVYGPIRLQYGYAHYGSNDAEGYDLLPEEMVIEACKAVQDQVNFADYDNDGDGYVDQVVLIYAGQSESSGASEDTVWPHEWTLGGAKKSLTLNGVKIDTYACSSELGYGKVLDGVGTICHEFSHCLGLPDMYDTKGNNYGMDSWDLMDYGCYNGDVDNDGEGDGYLPAGYTSYEKMLCGWLTPTELKEQTEIRAMKPMSESGEAYVIYNQARKDEYYLLENRQRTGWDAELAGSGLLVLHVDYDATAWEENTVNTVLTHQRCTVIPADGKASSYNNFGDPFPYQLNDSLTNTSKPAATLYNANVNGRKLMYCAVTGITQQDDGTISFNYRPIPFDTVAVSNSGHLFYESFDKCKGTGGNDNSWSGTIASSSFTPDNDGWTAAKGFGASQCAKFGAKIGNDGTVTTPGIALNGPATLTFMAGAWDSENDGTSLQVSVNDGFTILGEGTGSTNAGLQDQFTMRRGGWTTFKATITGKGTAYVTFVPGKRFFLDEVTVDALVIAGIEAVGTAERQADGRIYNLNGQYVGTDLNALTPGIYIVNGRKVVK